MIGVVFVNYSTKENFEVVCENVKIKSNVTNFSNTAKYDTLSVEDFVYSSENKFLEIENLTFESIQRDGFDVKDFKKFFRKSNSLFEILVTKNGETKFIYAKRNEDSVQQIFSTELEYFDFSVNKLSHWLKIKPATFTLDDLPEVESGYNISDYPENPDLYIYPHTYGETYGTIDQALFPLPPNEGDGLAYLDVIMLDVEQAPAFGLNTRYDNTFEAYEATSDFVVLESENLEVNSFPLSPRIRTYPKKNPTDEGTNREENRNYEKKTYLSIPSGEESIIYFTNVRKAVVLIYEQYFNL